MTTGTDIELLKEKIDSINREAWETRVNDSPRSLRRSEESLELAKSINYQKGIADGLRNIGFCHIRLARNDEAVPLLNEAFLIYQAIDDRSGQALVHEYLGIVHRNKGDFGGSLELLFKALALTENTPVDENHATHYYQLGVTYKHLGDFETALEYFYRAMTVCRAINNSLYEGYCINLIGSIYFENGDYLKALDYFLQGLPMRQAGGDKWGEAGSLDNIGFTYLKLNDLDKAIDYCKQSLAISQGTGDKKGEANALLHLAEIYEQAGDIKKASKCSNESLEIRKARGDKRGEAEVLLFLANLHKKRGDIEDQQIFEWISGAAKIADEIKAQDLLSKAYYNLHEYYGQKGNYKESLTQLEAHLKIEKELHKNTISQKVSNLEISHKAEAISQRNKELTELNEQIEKANAELRIEASLERVRAVAMGMKEPADMINVCRMISQELQQLGFKEIRNVQTVIIYPHKHEYLNYQYFTPYDKESIEIIDYRRHPDVLEFSNQMLSSPDAYYTKTFEGEELKRWREYRKQTNQLPDPRLDAAISSHYYFYSIGSGALGVTTYAPLIDRQIDLFKRFRNVFELAYKRFIDIEKALTQAREAQIETALERIRARAMAMHSSDELIEVANILREQMGMLGQPELETSVVNIVDENSGMINNWNAYRDPGLSSGEIKTSTSSFPINSSELTREMVTHYKSGEKEFTLNATGAKLHEFFEVLMKADPQVTNYAGDNIPEEIYYHFTSFTGGTLLTVSYQPPNEDVKSLQRRAASVFDMAYRRYLDLKKAEAQAREAQIETGLERVRSKTMAMHKSEEVTGVAVSLNEELLKLGFEGGSTIMIIDKETGDTEQWTGFSANKSLKSCFVPYFKHPYHDALLSAWKNGKNFLVYTVAGHEKISLDEHYFITGYKDFPESDKRWMRQMESVTFSHAFMKYGAIHWGPGHLTEEQLRILEKFSKVFEQSYTRFLDLQKAESQAREAQIQLALERVRARTMAMQKSEELQETNTIMFQQIESLGIPLIGDGIHVCHAGEPFSDAWMSDPLKGQMPKIRYDHTQDGVSRKMYEGWKNGERFLELNVQGEELKEHFEYVLPLIQNRNDYKEIVSDHTIFHFAYYSYGLLVFVTREQCPQDHSIFTRFAKVFEQTYTRFLDLQKAEAQAREAQIEAALERVRSRTMGMQRSDELPEAANLLFQQIESLGIHVFSTGYNIWQEAKKAVISWMSSQGLIQRPFKLPLTEEPALIECYEAASRGDAFYVQELSGDKLLSHLSYMRTLPVVGELMGQMNQAGIPLPHRMFNHHAFFLQGYLMFITYDPVPEAHEIFKRFAKVFEQTYTRFLDLQKAEAQAREAQIEAALERVRSRSMAMHKSDELLEVVASVFQQMQLLGFNLNLCNIVLFDNKTLGADYFASGIEQAVLPESYHVPYADHPLYNYQLSAWKNAEPFAVFELSGEIKKSWEEILFTKTDLQRLPESTKKMMQQLDKVILSSVATKHGLIQAIGTEQLSGDDVSILSRFANVFDQTYTRFLDLKKAEAQAKEAQIEAALERVRSRTMGMQKSDELKDVVAVVFEQLLHLGFPSQGCGIVLYNKKDLSSEYWITIPGDTLPQNFTVPYFDHPYIIEELEAWKTGIVYKSIVYEGELKKSFEEFVLSHSPVAELPDEVKEALLSTERMVASLAFMDCGSLSVIGPDALSQENAEILQRFTKVFDQTYTRFLDLQKAEAQARDAQIEAALEKVRAKVMAMKSSADLNETSLVFGEQLRKLGIDWQFSYFWLIEEDKEDNTFWITWPDNKTSTTTYSLAEADESFRECIVAWREQTRIHATHVPAQDVQSWLDTFERITNDAGGIAKDIMTPGNFREGVYYYDAMIKFGSFGITTNRATNDEEKNIQSRFAIEFERAYTRFLDLKKAEAQAREAQIEVAVERVRAKALAMHKSEDLHAVVVTLKKELHGLRIPGVTAATIYLQQDDGSIRILDLSTAREDEEDILELNMDTVFRIEDTDPDLWVRRMWYGAENYFVVEAGEDDFVRVVKFLYTIDKESAVMAEKIIKEKSIKKAWLPTVRLEKGRLNIDLLVPPVPEVESILLKMGAGFDLAYKRFLDLQKAETQTREANIEVALERVRARALAMQQPEELKDVAQVLRNEMGALGVEELETSSIYIHGESDENVECWYALQDPKHTEKKMVSDHFLLDLNETWVGREMKKFYSSDEKQTSIVMQGANRKEWIAYCYTHSPAFSGFYGETIPDRTYHLYKFSHGYIGAAAPGEISAESWKLLGRAASVFSLAYSRFKDLTQARIDLVRLKEEKKRAEDALTELQNTQKQLIQTEKMASLGELTAGIAHEIQNPLNFVNNFSDVSNELIEEMKEELRSGNTEQAMQIIDDVKDNLEKILHHGKRADGIVKGMLQHSRSSSGIKELTDINNLADEYLRLAYHGFRAKDKSFSAKFETHFDNNMEKINVVPQDIGRVILNLINNAFYTVNEKKKRFDNARPSTQGDVNGNQPAGRGYEPIVRVTTKKSQDKIEISVKDNGNGIPQKMLDKIFQPFFTTKPTGQGTGLGLSLSYDIITKGHHGEIKVETKEGDGCEFTISLPLN